MCEDVSVKKEMYTVRSQKLNEGEPKQMIYLLFQSRYKSNSKHVIRAVIKRIAYPCIVILNPNCVAFIQH